MPEVRIHVAGDDAITGLVGLRSWLSGERALGGRVRPVWRPEAPGELGGMFDALAVAVGSGGAGAALAGSLSAWVATRRSHVTVTVTSQRGSVALEADNLRQDEVLSLLQQAMRDGGDHEPAV